MVYWMVIILEVYMKKADTFLTNAVIYTVDPSRPYAGAVAVRDGCAGQAC
jgi:hypothetical protein